MPTNAPPKQPELNDTPSVRRDAVRAHRQAIIDCARERPGEWITYWVSPTKATARNVKAGMKKHTVGQYTVQTKDYAQHGANGDESWSIRLDGLATQVRFNGPWSPGQSVVPEWAPTDPEPYRPKDRSATLDPQG